jgi:serine/threonine protein kinase/Tfp pilus assembly protein PilF
MGIKCPKCQHENPDDTLYCGKCATSLKSPDDVSISVTKTIVSPAMEGSTVAGKYRIIEKLGEGGMGVVYKAEDTRLKRTVALKFMPPELMRDSDAKERFVREAQAAAALSHPNICTVYEIDEEEGKSFIVMEYIEGQSIREKVKISPLEISEALDIAIQAAQGLQEAHKRGIIHRDIKSANIMVTESGQAKVMDFGLAKVTGASLLTREASTMGTVAYMSPEQAQGQSVDKRTDIWSLGVVMYEMLTGQLPFLGDTDQSVMYAIARKTPVLMKKIMPKVTPDLDRVVEKTLEKNPADRYQSMGELLEDLKAIAEGLKPLRAKARLFKGRILGLKKSHFIAGVLVLVALFIAGIFTLFPSRSEALDSIAVLPLVNYSGDLEQEYFADSLTDQLTADLYKISALRVIPPQSVKQYKKTEKSPKEIARELNVKAIVQASVLRSENKVRINAFLIDPAHDRQIWSDTFERETSDIFFLQSDLSQAIVSAIKVVITPEEKALLADAHKVDPEAYDLYMKGYSAYLVYNDHNEALNYFNQAINKDPDFALPYAYIGMVYWDLGINAEISEKEAYPKAKEAIIKALELDENLAIARSNLAWLKCIMDWDFYGAEQEFRRSLELEPGNIDVQYLYNIFLRIMGRFDEGIERQKHFEESMPPGHWPLLGSLYMWAGRYDEGFEEAKKAYKKNPVPLNKYWLAFAYELKGMYQEALSLHEELLAIPDRYESSLQEMPRIYALLGKIDEAYATIEQLKSIYAEKGIDPSFDLAIFYTALGDKDKAFEFLNQAYENHSGTLVNIKTFPYFLDLHSDPRFQELVKKMGFPEDQRLENR